MDNPAALQLRYLQTLNSISAENNSTIVFPVPVDVLNTFMGPNNGSQRHKVNIQYSNSFCNKHKNTEESIELSQFCRYIGFSCYTLCSVWFILARGTSSGWQERVITSGTFDIKSIFNVICLSVSVLQRNFLLWRWSCLFTNCQPSDEKYHGDC